MITMVLSKFAMSISISYFVCTSIALFIQQSAHEDAFINSKIHYLYLLFLFYFIVKCCSLFYRH